MKEKVLIIIIVLVFAVSCKENQVDVTNKGYYDQVISSYKNIKVNSETVKSKMKEYFGDNPYTVIWDYPIGYDNKRIYFAIEECPDVYHGLKKGIIMDENGTIEAKFERDKGIYSEKGYIVDFHQMGFKKDEISCIVAGFNDKEIEKTVEEMKKHESYYLFVDLYFLDKELNNIFSPKEFRPDVRSLAALSIGKGDKQNFVFNTVLDLIPEKDFIERSRKFLEEYREGKRKGKVFKSPAGKQEFERVRKNWGLD